MHRLIAPTTFLTALFCLPSVGFAIPLARMLRAPVLGGAGTSARSWIAPEARSGREHLLYVADTYENKVLIYKQRGHNQQPVGQLTTDMTFPTSIWVDTERRLWVANVNSELESTVLRFPQGSTTPDLIIPDPNWNIAGVWVSRSGNVYVINIGYYGNSQILEYPAHHKTARTLFDPNLGLIDGLVGDAAGDLFASGLGGSSGEVDELPAGSTKWQNTGIAASEPAGLVFDAAGNFVVADIGPDTISTYPPGQTTPSNTIACSAQCWSIAFNHRGDTLWVDEVNDIAGTIDKFTYPGGSLVESLPQGVSAMTQGVATGPDLYP